MVRMRDAKRRAGGNQQHLLLEAEMGVEPIHVGFADQCLPTWLLRRYRQFREQSVAMPSIAGRDRSPSVGELSIRKAGKFWGRNLAFIKEFTGETGERNSNTPHPAFHLRPINESKLNVGAFRIDPKKI